MNIKTRLYITSVVLAIITVVLTKLTYNGLMQCIPYCILYLTVLYYIDDIRPKAFWGLFSFCYVSYLIFEAVAIAGISLTANVSNFTVSSFISIALLNVLLALILAVTQIPFILKALRKNK